MKRIIINAEKTIDVNDVSLESGIICKRNGKLLGFVIGITDGFEIISHIGQRPFQISITGLIHANSDLDFYQV